jgi:hypothetical protein
MKQVSHINSNGIIGKSTHKVKGEKVINLKK